MRTFICLVAGRHPLKQGLKPIGAVSDDMAPDKVAGRHPLKQGLKLYCAHQ